MENVTKGNLGDIPVLQEEQSWRSKPSSHLASAKRPLSPGSPFQAWKKPYCMGHGGAGAISIRASSRMKLASSSSSQVADDHSRKHQIPDPGKRIPTNVTASAISRAEDTAHASKTGQTEATAAEQPNLGANFDPNKDPKQLRRIVSNRLSVQRFVLRKMKHAATLKTQVKELEEQNIILHSQIQAFENHKQSLMLEQKSLVEKLSVWEQTTILQEAEIEKKKAEVSMLRELHKIQEEQFQTQQTMMMNWDSDLNQTSFNFSSNAAQDRGQISNMEANIEQEQDPMLMTNWEIILQALKSNSAQPGMNSGAQDGGRNSNTEANIEQEQDPLLTTNWKTILQALKSDSAQLPGMNSDRR